jgi:septal ring factor EnvC (AmiA/AmiB activator)
MTKIEPALDRLHTALEKLGTGVHQSHRSADAAQAKTAALDNECAHLRAEVSALKKHNQELEARCRRGAQHIEKVMGQIDSLLEGD